MPALGKKILCGKRNTIVSKSFWTRFKKENEIDISYEDFKNIIWESNQLIADTIIDDSSGFKLPESLGYLVIKKYRTKKLPRDYNNSNKLNRVIYLHNAHSFGNKFTLKWFKRGQTGSRSINIHIIKGDRKFKRNIAKSIKSGKEYHEWTNADFWSRKTILNKLYNINYNKKRDNGNNNLI